MKVVASAQEGGYLLCAQADAMTGGVGLYRTHSGTRVLLRGGGGFFSTDDLERLGVPRPIARDLISRVAAQLHSAERPSAAIADLLARSAQAWNRGDLATFMSGYEDSPATEYVSSKTVIHGYAAIRAHYAARYGTTGMPALSISDLDVRPLGPDYAVVVAHWHLAPANGTHPSGIFTLVMHRSATRWHIITDHSP